MRPPPSRSRWRGSPGLDPRRGFLDGAQPRPASTAGSSTWHDAPSPRRRRRSPPLAARRRRTRPRLRGGAASALLPLKRCARRTWWWNQDTSMYGRTVGAALGAVDSFISHSWQDDGPAKFAQLTAWGACCSAASPTAAPLCCWTKRALDQDNVRRQPRRPPSLRLYSSCRSSSSLPAPPTPRALVMPDTPQPALAHPSEAALS